MYIPRPAKLLFTVDDGWNKFPEKFGDSVTPWTRLCVERMLACGPTDMGVRRFCCSSPGCTHGWAEIDNNIAEDALRGVALGRKTGCSSVQMRVGSGQQCCIR